MDIYTGPPAPPTLDALWAEAAGLGQVAVGVEPDGSIRTEIVFKTQSGATGTVQVSHPMDLTLSLTAAINYARQLGATPPTI